MFKEFRGTQAGALGKQERPDPQKSLVGFVVGDITIADNSFGRGGEYAAAHVNVPVTWARNVWLNTPTVVGY